MARGQAQAADKQLSTTNAIGADERSRQQALENKLMPGYTSLMNTGFMSPAEENAARTSEMGAAEQPFESAGFTAANRAAATHNAADLTAEEEQLARDKGLATGTAAENFQKEKMNNELAGMYGIGQLRSEDLNAMQAMYGMGPSTLNARAAGGPSPWWGLAEKAIGAAGAAAA